MIPSIKYVCMYVCMYVSTEKSEQKDIGSSIFRMFSPRRYCRYRIYLECVLFRSSFSQPCHTSPCALCAPPPPPPPLRWSPPPPPPPLRCPLSLPAEALFLRLLLFSLRRCGVASPGRSALAFVPELHVSSFRHAAWLNFAGFALLVTSLRIASCYPQ